MTYGSAAGKLPAYGDERAAGAPGHADEVDERGDGLAAPPAQVGGLGQDGDLEDHGDAGQQVEPLLHHGQTEHAPDRTVFFWRGRAVN